MGTPAFAVPSLRAMAAEPDFRPLLVVTGPDKPRRSKHAEPEPTPVKRAAMELSLPVYETDEVKSSDFAAMVASCAPEVIVVAAFRILPPEVYTRATLGAFNLHASLLPAYRGAAPVNWAVINGETETGVTTFFLQQSVDTGSILLDERVAIGPDERADELVERLADTGAGLVIRTLRQIADGSAVPRLQNDAEASRAPKLTRENTRIEWNRPVKAVHDFVRGLAMKPTAWTTWGGKSLKIFSARPLSGFAGDHLVPPGTLSMESGLLAVRCLDGWLELLTIQVEGKKMMPVSEFTKGLRSELLQEPLL